MILKTLNILYRVKSVSCSVLPPNESLCDIVTFTKKIQKTAKYKCALLSQYSSVSLSIYCSVTMTFCFITHCSRAQRQKENNNNKKNIHAFFSHTDGYHMCSKGRAKSSPSKSKKNCISNRLTFTIPGFFVVVLLHILLILAEKMICLLLPCA